MDFLMDFPASHVFLTPDWLYRLCLLFCTAFCQPPGWSNTTTPAKWTSWPSAVFSPACGGTKGPNCATREVAKIQSNQQWVPSTKMEGDFNRWGGGSMVDIYQMLSFKCPIQHYFRFLMVFGPVVSEIVRSDNLRLISELSRLFYWVCRKSQVARCGAGG